MVRFLGQDARPDRVPVLTGLADDTLQDVPGPGQGEDGWLHVGEYIIEHRDSAAMIEKSKTLAMFSDFAGWQLLRDDTFPAFHNANQHLQVTE